MLARVAHDAVCHVLIGLSGGAEWAHRFHDWIGARWVSDDPATVVVVRGHGDNLASAVRGLEAAGFTVVAYMHDVATLTAGAQAMRPSGAIDRAVP